MLFLALLGWSAHASEITTFDKLGPDLKLLHALHSESIIGPFQDRISGDTVSVSIRFSSPPPQSLFAQWENSGSTFKRRNGELLQIGQIYFAHIPWNLVKQLEKNELVERVDLAQPLHVQPPLDVSIRETGAFDVNRFLGSGNGSKLLGTDIVIANFDTGVDVLHPDFFYTDAGAAMWFDADGDNVFTPGIDGIDLDEDGVLAATEILHVLHSQVNSHTSDAYYGTASTYEADVDWLYLDTNGDEIRNSGSDEGFSDADEGFGEPIYIVEDVNENYALDYNERVLQLGSSKVVASIDGDDGEIHTLADANIIDTEGDINGHGTPVSSIILGGHANYRRYRGLAPEASLILGDIYNTISHAEAIAWAKDEGADVMLHEISVFNGQYLDGSSNREVAVEEAHNEGITQVCPAGNVGKNYRHASVNVVADEQWQQYYFYSPEYLANMGSTYFFLTVLSQSNLDETDVYIRTPNGSFNDYMSVMQSSEYSCDSDTAGHYFCSTYSQSSNNTFMYYGYVTNYSNFSYSTPNWGWWQLWLRNNGTDDVFLDLWLTDDVTSFGGGLNFVNTNAVDPGYIGDEMRSVASPATVPECIGVASYSTRADSYEGVMTPGSYDLSYFSGRGPRIDGVSLIDIAAPGNSDIISSASSNSGYDDGAYRLFGGTSAAGPHVAAAAALLLQDDATRTPDDVIAALRNGAVTDSYMGTLPDEEWGYGKMNIENSLLYADSTPPVADVMEFDNPLLPDTGLLLVMPTETLGTAPAVSVTNTNGDTSTPSLTEVGSSWWLGFASSIGNTLSIDSMTDLAGNDAQ